MGLEDSQKLARLAAAGTRLHIDGGTAEVLDSFDRAGVRAIMLKGPSIARWLYTDGTERRYNDCDLLVAPEQFDAAGQTLRALGYEPLLDRWGLPAWWYGHAVAWTHPDGRVGVDLHRTLLGVGVNPATVWRVLSADPDELVVAGRRVRCLGLPARTMHVALHATQHGPGTQPAVDLERAITVCDDALWVGAARLAAQLDATAAFVAGLRLTPAGARIATRLALPDVRSITAELRASTPPRSRSGSRSWRGLGRCGRARRSCGGTSPPGASAYKDPIRARWEVGGALPLRMGGAWRGSLGMRRRGSRRGIECRPSDGSPRPALAAG